MSGVLRVPINEDLITLLLTDGVVLREGYRLMVEHGLPPDSELTGAHIDRAQKILWLSYTHPSFPAGVSEVAPLHHRTKAKA